MDGRWGRRSGLTGQPREHLHQPPRQLLDPVDHRPARPEDLPDVVVRPRVQADAVGVQPQPVQRAHGLGRVGDQVRRVRDINVGGLAIGEDQQQALVGAPA